MIMIARYSWLGKHENGMNMKKTMNEQDDMLSTKENREHEKRIRMTEEWGIRGSKNTK